jgi:hypothetical protein
MYWLDTKQACDAWRYTATSLFQEVTTLRREYGAYPMASASGRSPATLARFTQLHLMERRLLQVVWIPVYDYGILMMGMCSVTLFQTYADTMNRRCLAVLQGHTSLVGQLQMRGDVLVTGGSDGSVRVWSLTEYQPIHRLAAHDNSVTSLQFDDTRIVSGGSDGRVKVWDLKKGTLVRELSKPADAVWRVVFEEEKAVIMASRNQKTIMEVSQKFCFISLKLPLTYPNRSGPLPHQKTTQNPLTISGLAPRSVCPIITCQNTKKASLLECLRAALSDPSRKIFLWPMCTTNRPSLKGRCQRKRER